MDDRDEIIKALKREVEIGQQQVQGFVQENARFRALVDTVNLNCRALQQEILMVNLRSMEVTKALILRGGDGIMDGTGRCVWLTKDELTRASKSFVLEKCNKGDPDYIDAKEDGDLLIRLRESTREERAKVEEDRVATTKAEAERASPAKPKPKSKLILPG